MKHYFGASWVDPQTIRLHWATTPTACLSQRSGRVSPIYPLRHDVDRTDAPQDGHVVFVFPRRARQLMADIQNDFPEAFVGSAYISHGLAACVFLLPPDVAEDEIHVLLDRPDVLAYETWPVREGLVRHEETSIRHPAPPRTDVTLPSLIDDQGIPEPIAQELRQFNANLLMFASLTRDYLPDYEELVDWLHSSVTSRIEAIRTQATESVPSSPLTPRMHHDVGILVDANSCLTMVISQAAGVLPPIFNSNYPVGEFSLLGIGSAVKAAWQIYQSIAAVFATADHVTRLRSSFTTASFDPGFRPSHTDYESWHIAGGSSASSHANDSHRPGRKHLVYFSSRWGFHETLNSISLSWQSITACATRHWNLLTISHEFLHSHFREVVRTNVLDVQNQQQLVQVCDTYNAMLDVGWNQRPSSPASPFQYVDSFRAFLLNQMSWCQQAALYRAGNGVQGDIEWRVQKLTPESATELINTYLAEYVEEYIVHIMDFHYFFDADDNAYLSSIWHSWSLVPFVHRKLHHYLLRSLLAIASASDSSDAAESFASSWKRLVHHFEEMLASHQTPIAADALDLLNGQLSGEALWIEFKYSFQLVPFTRTFLIDPELNSRLSFDPLTSNGQRYGFREGEFSASPLASPTAFLLDRYEHAHTEREPADLASLWQLLMLA